MTTVKNTKKVTIFPPEVQFGIDLARRISTVVMPILGIKEKNVPIDSISKDPQYAIDQRAETEIKTFFKDAWTKGMNYGYVTEGQGIVFPPRLHPSMILLIDPIDGSRPAQLGAEMACVTLVGTNGKQNPTFTDIQFGVTHALKENRTFVSVKSEGVSEIIDNRATAIHRRNNLPKQLKDCSVVMESYSMTLQYVGVVMDPLVAEVGFKTDYPSGSYSSLTLVRGANEIHVDVRKRIVDDFSHLRVMAKPSSKALFPMDVASCWLMINELGGEVTDAYGQSLNNVRLWQFEKNGSWSSKNQISWVAALNKTLHQKTMGKLKEGFANLKKFSMYR